LTGCKVRPASRFDPLQVRDAIRDKWAGQRVGGAGKRSQVSTMSGNDRQTAMRWFAERWCCESDARDRDREGFKGPGRAGQGPSDWFPVSTVCRSLKTPSLAIGGSALKAAKHGSHREHIAFGFWHPLRGPSRPLTLAWSSRIGGLNGQVFARAVPRRTELACGPAALGAWRFAANSYVWIDALRRGEVRRAALWRH
jgi:hypothetical protein